MDCCLTVLNGTDRHAPTQAGCALGPQHQNTVVRVCREAGESVRFNAKDMNVAVPADDAEAEVLVSGLPLFYGAQLAMDITGVL